MVTKRTRPHRDRKNHEGIYEANIRWQKRNRETYRLIQWEAHLRNLYGMTMDQYHALLEYQQELCAACGDVLSPVAKETHVDHDHETGRIRGLLCSHCNNALGLLHDSLERCRCLVRYMER